MASNTGLVYTQLFVNNLIKIFFQIVYIQKPSINCCTMGFQTYCLDVLMNLFTQWGSSCPPEVFYCDGRWSYEKPRAFQVQAFNWNYTCWVHSVHVSSLAFHNYRNLFSLRFQLNWVTFFFLYHDSLTNNSNRELLNPDLNVIVFCVVLN